MSNLLVRAEADIKIAKLLMSPEGNPSNEEMITDQAAYHAQQAIEKALKYQTEMMGLDYTRTHNLTGLIATLEKQGFTVADDLKGKAFEISDWEASSRYKDDFMVVKSEIEKAISMYEELKGRILEDTEKKTGDTAETE
ncbi:MAG: HEPN domain-containing protein [Lachnospiraceae bacterium]|nr:HEPN domain-containing protein [Lachnospiraceae bacterium]